MKNFIHTNSCHAQEDSIKDYIKSLSKDSIFYDLGANLGWFSLYAASLGLETHAFEIDKDNFRGLRENTESFGLSNHYIYNIGIADTNRKVNLRKINCNIGEHHKTIDIENFSADNKIVSYNFVEEVEVDSIDNIIKNKKIPYPNAMKVDIDGSEYAFLLGAKETLKYVNSMVIELFVKSQYHNNIVKILKENGFKEKAKLKIPKESDLFNFIFVKI